MVVQSTAGAAGKAESRKPFDPLQNPFLAPFVTDQGTIFVKQTPRHHLVDGLAVLRLARALPLEADVRFVPVVPPVVWDYSLPHLLRKWVGWRLGLDGHILVPRSEARFRLGETLPEDLVPVAQQGELRNLEREFLQEEGSSLEPHEMAKASAFLLALQGDQERPDEAVPFELPDHCSLLFADRPALEASPARFRELFHDAGYPNRFAWQRPETPGPRGPDVYTLVDRQAGTRWYTNLSMSRKVDYGFIFLQRVTLHSPRYVLMLSGGTSLGTWAAAHIVTDAHLLTQIGGLAPLDKLAMPVEIAFRVDLGKGAHGPHELSASNIELLDWSVGEKLPATVSEHLYGTRSRWNIFGQTDQEPELPLASGEKNLFTLDHVHGAVPLSENSSEVEQFCERPYMLGGPLVGQAVETLRRIVADRFDQLRSEDSTARLPDLPMAKLSVERLEFERGVYRALADPAFERASAGRVLTIRRNQRRELPRTSARPALLIVGPNGTGKELAARIFHDAWLHCFEPHPLGGARPLTEHQLVTLGPRQRFQGCCRFVARNLRVITETLAQPQLEGIFPDRGVHGNDLGPFIQAGLGVVFLDEVGDATLDTQVRLLRILQEREVQPVMCPVNIPIACCIVAATEQPLERMVLERTFRAALLARLAGYQVALSPLSERLEDVPLLLLADLIQKSSGAFRRLRISASALAVLLSRRFDLNTRELHAISNRLRTERLRKRPGVAELKELREDSPERDFVVRWEHLDSLGLVPGRTSEFHRRRGNECVELDNSRQLVFEPSRKLFELLCPPSRRPTLTTTAEGSTSDAA